MSDELSMSMLANAASPPGPDVAMNVARAICRESCAYRGEPPCWQISDEWPNPHCDEPGCEALAKAAVAAAPPVAQGEYDDHTAAIIATARFTASYAKRANEPAKVDSVFLDAIADALAALQATVELIKCQHNALNVDLRAAQARIAELEAALERIDRESREEMGACQDVFDLGEIARAALAPVSGFNEPEPHTPQYPPHVVPTWGKP